MLGAAAVALGPEIVFSSVALAGVGLLVWALLTPARPPAGPPPTIRAVLAALREPRIGTGMWLIVLVGLMFGTLDVLAPLRLDELGATAAVIGGHSSSRRRSRRGRARSSAGSPTATAACCRRSSASSAAGVMVALLPWPEEAWVLVVVVLVAAPCIGILWTPSMAMLSDGAEDRGIEQGYAVALTNLAWSTGQTLGSAGGARLGEVYGDALPYLALAAACALTLAAVSPPRYAAALAGRLTHVERAPAIRRAGRGRGRSPRAPGASRQGSPRRAPRRGRAGISGRPCRARSPWWHPESPAGGHATGRPTWTANG